MAKLQHKVALLEKQLKVANSTSTGSDDAKPKAELEALHAAVEAAQKTDLDELVQMTQKALDQAKAQSQPVNPSIAAIVQKRDKEKKKADKAAAKVAQVKK